MNIENEIDAIHEQLQESISNLYEIMTFIEDSEEFQRQSEVELKQYFFHLYIKSKRNFQAINVLINSEELQNGYVEATVLLRVMTESYLHLCYLMQTNEEQLLKEYKELNNMKVKQLLRSENPAYVFRTKNKTEDEYLEKLKFEYDSKKIKIPRHLRYMSELADITDNKIIYHSIYEMFNTYVHFNPTTYISYGTKNEDGSFTYNSFSRKPKLEARIIFFAVHVQMILAKKLFAYLKISEAPDDIIERIAIWNKFAEGKKPSVIFTDIDDYI